MNRRTMLAHAAGAGLGLASAAGSRGHRPSEALARALAEEAAPLARVQPARDVHRPHARPGQAVPRGGLRLDQPSGASTSSACRSTIARWTDPGDWTKLREDRLA